MPESPSTATGALARWALWTVPISVLAGPLAVALVIIFSTSDWTRLFDQLTMLVSWEYMPMMMLAGLLFVPVFGAAILAWAAIVRAIPTLDRSWLAISLVVPSVFLLVSASYSMVTEGFHDVRLISLPGPFLVGCLALIPRRLDPKLRHGSISFAEPLDAA